MTTSAFCLILGVALIASDGRDQTTVNPHLDPLSRLIGAWDVHDTHQPLAGPPSIETGVRTCSYALGGQYIECTTQARNASGRQREYRWLINFNTATSRYDLIGVFSNYSGKDVKSFRVDAAGRVWNIRSAVTSTDEGVERWYWATLEFDGNDRAVWTGYRNAETDSPQTWQQSSRETWVRRPVPR